MSELGVEAARRLVSKGACTREPGLTEVEFARVEEEFGFEFADDHRAFLATVLPVERHPGAHTWPDWRDGDPAVLRAQLDRPIDGVLFDVEHNRFWHRGWGERPADIGEALVTARKELAEVPRLVPVYGHRFLPAGRGTSGHPVMSIHQTDMIYYGADLADYIEREFGYVPNWTDWDPQATVPFWSDFL